MDTGEPQTQITVERFEIVRASDRTMLLRLALSAAPGVVAPGTEAELVVTVPDGEHRFAQLPPPAAAGGSWRIAFVVPAAVVGAEPRYRLTLTTGASVTLPAPGATAPARPEAHGVPGPDGRPIANRRMADYERLALQSEMIAAERRARESSERRLQGEFQARLSAESELARVRERLDEALSAWQDGGPRSAESERLQQQLDDALAELVAVNRSEREAADEVRALRAVVARQAARLEALSNNAGAKTASS